MIREPQRLRNIAVIEPGRFSKQICHADAYKLGGRRCHIPPPHASAKCVYVLSALTTHITYANVLRFVLQQNRGHPSTFHRCCCDVRLLVKLQRWAPANTTVLSLPTGSLDNVVASQPTQDRFNYATQLKGLRRPADG